MIEILVVDDQSLIRRALQLLLADEPDLAFVGESDCGEAALDALSRHVPDVVLMDLLMPGMGGVEATRLICQRYATVRVLVLSIDDHGDRVAQAMKYGASGYLMKNTPPEELAIAIRAVHKGYTHLGPGLGQKVLAQIPDPILVPSSIWQQLTSREQEVVGLISKGANNREIAQNLHISEKTVKNHITNILNRLDLRDRTQVAILAHQQPTTKSEGIP
ncbi:MAG: response regulator transcription factor [Oscillatoriales cyanobacterium SM2_2_1]|nr:response regulator transcription factor [Oscillatoriales cyanobacterium SM2_2_1]